MAKKAYIGVDGVARKVKNGYVGVDGTARKVKKAYIGIGGVARPCWSCGELAYYGTITPLSVARYELAATTIGGYALFGGGGYYQGENIYVNNVDAYDRSFTHSLPTALTNKTAGLQATSNHSYALFADQGDYNVDAYNSQLTKIVAPTLTLGANVDRCPVNVGNYALFCGGYNYSSKVFYTSVDAYDGSLSKAYPSLSQGKRRACGTTFNDYAIVAGGQISDSYSSSVDVFDASLTRTNPTTLSVGRFQMGVAANAKYAIFAGGYGPKLDKTNYFAYNTIDVIDTNFTRTNPMTLSTNRYGPCGAYIGGLIMIGGGYQFSPSQGYSTVIEIFDENLTRTTQNTFPQIANYATAILDNSVLFGGGSPNGSGARNIVDVFTVA